MIEYVLLDVSGTILHKPVLFFKLQKVLEDFGYVVDLKKIQYNHKLLSETIKFPDRTDAAFYQYFNTELLFSLGILPTGELLGAIFDACTYLPWEKYDDTEVLHSINKPIGILSNFNSGLEDKLNNFFGPIFQDIFVSEIVGKSKPSIEFYEYALKKLNIEAQKILYIGDSFKLDFKPAKELGFTTFVIDREGFYNNSLDTISSLYEIKKIL